MARILILRADHLGDAILTTPLIRALAKAGHEVDFVLPKAFQPLFIGNPHLRECLGIEEIVTDTHRHWFRLARWMRARHYDILILPFGRPWQLLLASLLSGTRIRIAMWSGIAGRLTFHRCLRSGYQTKPRPMADIILDCARILDVSPDGLLPEIVIGSATSASQPDRLPRVGIHPGCAGSTCNFSPAGYEEIVRLILDRTNWEIVLTGAVGERKLIAQWNHRLIDSPRIRDTIGTLSLPQLAETIRSLDLFISPSTGPLHIASALDIATLTPFCSRACISHRVWGNIRPNGHYQETTAQQCRGAQQHCDFTGKISPLQFFEQSVTAMKKIHLTRKDAVLP